MKIKALIDELIGLGIKLSVEDGELKITGPKQNIKPGIIDTIRENKNALMEYLDSSSGINYLAPGVYAGKVGERNVNVADELKPVDFSLFYFGNTDSQGSENKYRLLIEGAKYADANGYAAVWTPERHFNEFGGLYPSPSVLSAAIAAITKHIQIRAGSVVIPLHNPLRIAEEWSVIDNLSGGRVGIACAPGWQSNDFVLNPSCYKKRHEVMYQSIDTIRKLWKGEAINLEDGNGNQKDTRIFPRPVQKELPLWITSRGNIDTFISAGKLGFNVLTHLLGETVEELSVKVNAYRDAYTQNGHNGRGKVTLMLHTYLDADREKAYDKARIPFINYLRTALGLIRNDAISWGYNVDSENFTKQDLEDMLDYSFYRYVSQSSLIGSKADAMNMLEIISTIGVDEIASLIDFGVAIDDAMNSLEYLTAVKDEYNSRFAVSKTSIAPAFSF